VDGSEPGGDGFGREDRPAVPVADEIAAGDLASVAVALQAGAFVVLQLEELQQPGGFRG
jgi:hypothetical protein